MQRKRAEVRPADRRPFRALRRVTGIGVAAAAAFSIWVMTPAPSSLHSVFWVAPAPSGDWMVVSGEARWHPVVFFENVRTGQWLRRPAARGPGPVVSEDGSAAAFVSSSFGLPDPPFTPRTLGLSDPRHREIAFESKDLHEFPLFVFSADAGRLAVISAARIEVWDRSSGRLLSAARPPSPLWENGRGFSCATFAGPDTLRVYAVRPSPLGAPGRRTIEIVELEVPSRRIVTTGHAGPFERTFPILTDAPRRRLLVRDTPASVVLLDAHDGTVLRRFEGNGAVSRSAEFLSDGRLAIFEGDGAAARLRVISSEDGAEPSIPLGSGERALLLGEISPGHAILRVGSRKDPAGSPGRILVVDLAARTVDRWADRLSPAAPYAATLAGDPGTSPAPGSLGTHLFFDSDRRLVELTGPGRMRAILPAR